MRLVVRGLPGALLFYMYGGAAVDLIEPGAKVPLIRHIWKILGVVIWCHKTSANDMACSAGVGSA